MNASLLFGRTALAGTLLVLAWLAAGICGIPTGVFFFIPSNTLRELVGSASSAWMCATAAAVITPVFVIASWKLWDPTTAFTFELVQRTAPPRRKAMTKVANSGTNFR